MSKEEDRTQPAIEEKEIDLVDLAVKLWGKRRRILRWGLIGAVVGVIVALSIPKEYVATVTLVPESTVGKSSRSLGSLAALAGIGGGDMSGGREAVYPGLYPDVVSSVPFALDLSEVVLPTGIKDEETMALKQILGKHTSRPWWSVIMGFPSRIAAMFDNSADVEPKLSTKASVASDSVVEDINFYQPNSLQLSKSQMGLVGLVNSRVSVAVDQKTQLINITVTMQDALAAASLADTVANRLTRFVTAYRTNKARHDLVFAKQINQEAQQRYYDAQRAYAKALDRNQGIVLRSASIELERLQNEAALAYNLYNSTSQQVQVAEVKVQESTPVFTVMQPAVVPFKAAKPNVKMIIAGFAFLGIMGALGYTLIVPSLGPVFRDKQRSLQKQEQG